MQHNRLFAALVLPLMFMGHRQFFHERYW